MIKKLSGDEYAEQYANGDGILRDFCDRAVDKMPNIPQCSIFMAAKTKNPIDGELYVAVDIDLKRVDLGIVCGVRMVLVSDEELTEQHVEDYVKLQGTPIEKGSIGDDNLINP